jgi:hypothetical protein
VSRPDGSLWIIRPGAPRGLLASRAGCCQP